MEATLNANWQRPRDARGHFIKRSAVLSGQEQWDRLAEASGWTRKRGAGTALTAPRGSRKFDTDDAFWSANGGTISNIKYAVIWISGASTNARHLLCRSTLSSTQFSISSGNRLTITMNSSGVLTLT